jgi:hypothetical protein
MESNFIAGFYMLYLPFVLLRGGLFFDLDRNYIFKPVN